MPRGFDQCAPLDANVNPSGLDKNCYYCTVAALRNMDVRTLVPITETMQQDTANRNEVRALFGAAGLLRTGSSNKGIPTGMPGTICGIMRLTRSHSFGLL